MQHTQEHNALLLQVMAHDLLAPLTAVRWQTELLMKDIEKKRSPVDRIKSINSSAKLGIMLTKYAHVAGKVLTGTYTKEENEAQLTTLVNDAFKNLMLQYERHGLTLDLSIEEVDAPQTVDVVLTGLFVWSIAKFFLSCTPANSTVRVNGVSATEQGKYNLIVSVDQIQNAQELAHVFASNEARDAYDQAFIFASLVRRIAPMLDANVQANAQGSLLAVETFFVIPTH